VTALPWSDGKAISRAGPDVVVVPTQAAIQAGPKHTLPATQEEYDKYPLSDLSEIGLQYGMYQRMIFFQ
jgi:hypothetical protein